MGRCVRQLRKIVKSVVPYAVEARHIRRRYGRVDVTDAIGEFELPRWLRAVLCALPYGLTKAWLTRRFCPVSWQEHQAAFPAVVARLGAKVRAGERLNVLFLVSDAAMFAAESLYCAMSRDPLFAPRIAVIPDFRRLPERVEREMDRCADALCAKYAAECVMRLRPDAAGAWPDVVRGADIVCYPLPYDFSHGKYSIRRSAGLDVLPIHVNYGFYRSLFDREVMKKENYARFWRVFLECDYTMREYAAFSLTRGTNAALTGYVKMDALADVRPVAHRRRRVLVALHHSVAGGKNEELRLATVMERAAYLDRLPDAYPEIDFIFRPHPYLLQTLAQENVWGREKTDEFVRRLRAKSNVIWSEGGNGFQEFADSDACIQDCGSFLVEYLYTGKPCCYLLHSPADVDAKFAPLGKACLEQCTIACTNDEIDAFVRDVVIAGRDEKEHSRRALADSVMVNYPHAAEEALGAIRRALTEEESHD